MKANISWLDDPQIFRVNQVSAHSDHPYFKNYREWQQNNSSFIQKLNGNWKFKFSAFFSGSTPPWPPAPPG